MARRFVVVLVLTALCLADLAPLLATEPTPLDVFHRFYRDKSATLRLKAVAQLSGVRGAGVVEALLGVLTDEDREVRDSAAALLMEPHDHAEEIAVLVRVGLGRQRPEVRAQAAHALATCGRKALPELRAALEDRQGEVRRIASLSLAHLGDVPSSPKLAELIADKEALVRAAACEALGVLLGEDAVGTAQAVLLGDRSPEPRIAAAEVIGRYPRAQTAEQVARALHDGSWSVRCAASRALAGFHVSAEAARAAAAPLVRAIQEETRSRVRVEIAEALFSLTGIDFGPEPDRWRAWYAEAGRIFEPREKRPRRGLLAVGSTQGRLLDLALESEHVSFVLDYSGSMNDPIRFGAETTKCRALVESLEVALNRLSPNAYFNLIPFGSEPHPYKPALFAASPSAKTAAVRFMEKRVPEGRTNIYDSLEIALGDPEADTIVLLTDGAPTEGRRRTRSAILAGVRQLNRYRLARIHAVEVGAQNTSPRWKGFMKEIADATGGNYLQR